MDGTGKPTRKQTDVLLARMKYANDLVAGLSLIWAAQQEALGRGLIDATDAQFIRDAWRDVFHAANQQLEIVNAVVGEVA